LVLGSYFTDFRLSPHSPLNPPAGDFKIQFYYRSSINEKLKPPWGFGVLLYRLLTLQTFRLSTYNGIFTIKIDITVMTEITDILKNRRTIRKYSTLPVDERLLNEILSLACRTSTTGNMQVYSIIVTRDEKKKKELSPFHFNQKMITEAPVVLTFCADFNRFNKWCLLRKAEPGYDNFLSFFTAAIDALLVAQTACIAAESKGLGICYLGTTTYMARQIIDVLKLPKGVVPVTTVTLGWPAENPDQVDRLPLEAIVHEEEYKEYTPENINKYYFEKEVRSDSAQFIRENNKETLAQVFTDIRYTKKDNIQFSGALLEVLKEQGFMNQ
jgi:nitroreductase